MSDKKSCDKKRTSLVKRGISNALSFVVVHAVAVVKLVEIHTVGLVSRHDEPILDDDEPILDEDINVPLGSLSDVPTVDAGSAPADETVSGSEAKGKKRGCPIKYDEGSKYLGMVKDVYNIAKQGWTDLSNMKDSHKNDVTAFRQHLTDKLTNAM
jgi:hypothetical protein